MNFLIDTHVLIWSFTDVEKLSREVRPILEDINNNIFVSAISFWEVSLKFSLGKLELTGILPHEFPALAVQTGFKLIPVIPEETATYHCLKGTWHKDPFDRMLIWQAIQQDLIFISKDVNIAKYEKEGLRTLW
ncbi:MAG TPA: type II toxin-antitoxin system VapC family toxin [Salinimicrobium sp.]|nr:type II toxin-antitoxin system VapC family toxin [Salinimicrobium sp.]